MVVAVIIRFDTTITIVGTDTVPVFAVTYPTFCPVEQVVADFGSKAGNDQVFCVNRTTEPFESIVRSFVNLHILDNSATTNTEKRKSVKLLFTVIGKTRILYSQVFNRSRIIIC